MKLFAYLFIIPLFVLQGCANKVSTPWLDSTYKPMPHIRIDVNSVDIEKIYIPPEEPPFVDHNFSRTPLVMIEQWARGYLRPAGKVGRAVVKIQEASIVEHIEERNRSNSIPYTGRIELKIEFYESDGSDGGSLTATVVRTHYIPLELSVPDRQRAWRGMIEEMFGSLEPLVLQHMYQNVPLKMLK